MAEESLIGRKVGSWVLESELGQGGMGSVYLAKHSSLPIQAAVKVLSPGLESVESFRQRFRREADLQAQLRHPNIARILDYLEDQGRWFLVVEYVNGGNLAEVLAKPGGRVSRAQAILWARQALAGLGYAHRKGIVHRDVKPANLLLNENDEVVVADFGIARTDAAPGLTTTGISIGTPQYMSPEQILTPETVDQRADIYSLGIVLYELLSGRTPFDSGSQFAILQAHVSEPPPPLRSLDPEISPALEAVVMRALAKRAADRYPDCGAMERDLEGTAFASVGAPAPLPPVAGATVRQSVAPVSGVSVANFSPDPTMRATSLRSSPPAAPVSALPSMSAAEWNALKRRSFRRRMTVGAACLLAVAGLFAYQAAQNNTEDKSVKTPVSPGPSEIVSPPRPRVDSKPNPHTKQQGGGSTGTGLAPNRAPVLPESRERPPLPGPSANGFPAANPLPLPAPLPQQFSPPVAPPVAPRMPPMALPDRPQIAVLGAGDQLLAASLEQEMERRLSRRFDVVDEHGEPDVDELLEKKGAKISQKELGSQLVRSGFHVLVLIRVEEAERRTIEVHQLSGSLRAARIRLNAYMLPTGRTLGRGWTETLEYTELSAQGKAKNAFIGPTADLIQAIEDGWGQLRAGAAAGAAP